MKASLQLKMGQGLAMTPQLQQAIKLLQMHSLELKQEITQVLESNPLLELETDEFEITTDDYDGQDIDLSDGHIDERESYESEIDDFWDAPMSDYSVSAQSADTQSLSNDFDIWDTQAVLKSPSLSEHLLWQLNLTHLSEVDTFVAELLISHINRQGFLGEPVEDLLPHIQDNYPGTELDEVMAVLHRVQNLDPVGVGTYNLSECLHVQLQKLPAHSEIEKNQIDLAKVLVDKHLDDLASHDYSKLKRELNVKENSLANAISLIQSLNPNPSNGFDNNITEYIDPDVFVRKINGQWQVDLNPELAPALSINSLYASMIKRGDKSKDNTYLQENLQSAKWFMKSLSSRNDTILKVAQHIVAKQRLFFEYGEEAMKPLILKDIADDIDMHESTVSRVTTQKYMHTPSGIFEFKYFFSSHVSTSDGGECSATAIRAMIKRLIKSENKQKPFSDNALTQQLSEQGINVARRTVAKYRESLNIPPSNERKQL